MNVLSLFSGVGGLDLAAEWAGFSIAAFCERDPYCQRVLARHWPGVPIWDDVAELTIVAYADIVRQRARERSDKPARGAAGECVGDGSGVGIVSGGFPCQPHSVAGKRKASADERDLWSECSRIVGEFRPRWAVFENVPGLLTSERGTFFARVLGDLAALGYRVGWCVYGAVDVGAPHRRDRVFIVAHAESGGELSGRRVRCGVCGRWVQAAEIAGRENEEGIDLRHNTHHCRRCNYPIEAMADADDAGLERHDERTCAAVAAETVGADAGAGSIGNGTGRRLAQPGLGDLVDGLPRWLAGPGLGWGEEPNVPRVAVGVNDRVNKLRALGNAVVPAQAFPIFRAIADIEGMP